MHAQIMTGSTTSAAQNGSHKPPRKQIRGRLKTALDLMVRQGRVWNDAAAEADFTVSAMRKALERPHVIAYLRQQREVFRASVGGRNLHRLIELREQDEHKAAAVKVCQIIEQIGEMDIARGAGNAVRTPGMIIQIISGPAPRLAAGPAPLTIDHRVAERQLIERD